MGLDCKSAEVVVKVCWDGFETGFEGWEGMIFEACGGAGGGIFCNVLGI